MPTFTNENSALGDMGGHSGQLELGFLLPIFLGILLSTGTYLVCRETGAHTICIPVGLLIGFVAMSLCFVAEKERHMLIEDETSCISDSPNKAMRPNFWVWLRLQGFFLRRRYRCFWVWFSLETQCSSYIARPMRSS